MNPKYPGSAPNKLYRALEILPGVLAWGTLILMVVLSRYVPFWVAVFIIFFDTYWLFKCIYMSLHLRATFQKMKKIAKEDWLKKLKEHGGWEGIRHLVIFPMYKETYAVVRETFEALVRANYPLNNFIVVLALEGRAEESVAGESTIEIGRKIKEEFGNKFLELIITTHPDGISGELAPKNL